MGFSDPDVFLLCQDLMRLRGFFHREDRIDHRPDRALFDLRPDQFDQLFQDLAFFRIAAAAQNVLIFAFACLNPGDGISYKNKRRGCSKIDSPQKKKARDK